MQKNKISLLKIFSQGQKARKFEFCDPIINDLVKRYLSGDTGNFEIREANGFRGKLYILFSRDSNKIKGLVVRVLSENDKGHIERTARESTFLKQLHSTTQINFPRHFTTFKFEKNIVFISELLAGSMVSDTMLDLSAVINFADVISYTQSMLTTTECGQSMIAGIGKTSSYYQSNIAKYAKQYLNFMVDQNDLSFLDTLNSLRVSSPTIVSDRSPSNFVVEGTKTGVFDFDICLVGNQHEDWSWFIDDPRLKTQLDRNTLVDTFCNYHIIKNGGNQAELIYNFHLSAIFVCIKQFCFMHAAKQKRAGKHYLNKALLSAKALSIREAISLVETLLIICD